MKLFLFIAHDHLNIYIAYEYQLSFADEGSGS